MSKAEMQVKAIEDLIEQAKLLSSGFEDDFVTVNIAMLKHAMASAEAEWEMKRWEVDPIDEAAAVDEAMQQYREGKSSVREVLTRAGFDEEFIAAFIRGNAVCPECLAGKHENCDGTALSEDDEIVDCRCARQGHGE